MADTLPPLPEGDRFKDTLKFRRLGVGCGHVLYECWDEAVHAYAAQAVAEAVAQWQPIETAPRGSGMSGPSSVRHPEYVEPPKLLLWTQEGPVVGYYDWYYHPGYGHGAEEGESVWRDHDGGRTYGVTHWMPLPQPPRAGQGEPT